MESYTVHDINRLLALQNEHTLARLEYSGAQDEAHHVLIDDEAGFPARKARSAQALKTAYARDVLLKAEREEVAALRRQLIERREELLRRRARLKSARRILQEEILESHLISADAATKTQETEQEDESNKTPRNDMTYRKGCHSLRTITIPQLTEESAAVTKSLHARRKEMLSILEEIYPIEIVDPAHLLFSIARVPLPNLSDSSSNTLNTIVEGQEKSKELERLETDDDTISSALGYVAQVVLLLSSYLSTPLHYSIATAGSRAVIHDAISAINGPRVFPLYAKGMEHYRFEYAVFLLQKNIEQLLSVHLVSIMDIRHILPNLKNLIVSIISSSGPPKHRARRRGEDGTLGGGSSEITLRGSPAASCAPSRVASPSITSAKNDIRARLGFGDTPISMRHFVPSTPSGAAETIEESLYRRREEQRARQLAAAPPMMDKQQTSEKEQSQQGASGSSFAWLTWRGSQLTQPPKKNPHPRIDSLSKGAKANGPTAKSAQTKGPPVTRSLGT